MYVTEKNIIKILSMQKFLSFQIKSEKIKEYLNLNIY